MKSRIRPSAPTGWLLPLAWMALIFFLSGQSTLPDLAGLPDLQDVAGHFLAFGVLALLWHWNLARAGVRRARKWAFLLAILYAFADEFHQSFVPGRHPDFLDILTDAAGALAMLQLERLWRRQRIGE